MRPLMIALVVLLLTGLSAHAAVPVWGAKQSSPVDTPPQQLQPGEWIWGGSEGFKGRGPMAVVVSLTEQRAYAYRNGILIGVSTVSSGKAGYETPTGVFTILQKERNHHSSLYDSAPMPYQQRLTWDGIALHAGGLPGYPESHGCVHLPTEFARRLFEATNAGMTVVVSEEGAQPASVVHPRAITPIDVRTGLESTITPLHSGEDYRWEPEKSPEGPLSLVLSVPDGRVIVYRNGIEIGRANIAVRDPLPGTHAYIVALGRMSEEIQGMPGLHLPNWISIGVPGHDDEAGQPVGAELASRVAVPEGFLAAILPELTPGTVLLATDQPILPHTSGVELQVLDDQPPAASAVR
jgi:hypothetical protein